MARKSRPQVEVEEFYTVRFEDLEFVSSVKKRSREVETCICADDMQRFNFAQATKAASTMRKWFPGEVVTVCHVRVYDYGRMTVSPIEGTFERVTDAGVSLPQGKPTPKKPKERRAPLPRAQEVDPYGGRYRLDEYGFVSARQREDVDA